MPSRGPARHDRPTAAGRLRAPGLRRLLECRNPSLESPKMRHGSAIAGDSITLSNWATREMSVAAAHACCRAWRPRCKPMSAAERRRPGFSRSIVSSVTAVTDADGTGAMTGRWHVAGIAGGRLERSNWRSDGTQVDFFTLKGVVEDLLETVGARDVVFQPADRPPFVAGTAAEVSLGTDRPIGFIGEIDPKVVEFERVPFRVFAFELDLEVARSTRSRSLPVYHQLLAPAGRHARSRGRGPDHGVVCDLVDAIRSTAGPEAGTRSGWSTSIKALRSRPGTRVWPFTCFSGTPSAP